MFVNFTAKYTRIKVGYMGQLVELPEVVTEGKDLEHPPGHAPGCPPGNDPGLPAARQGNSPGNALIEQLPIDLSDVRQTA